MVEREEGLGAVGGDLDLKPSRSISSRSVSATSGSSSTISAFLRAVTMSGRTIGSSRGTTTGAGAPGAGGKAIRKWAPRRLGSTSSVPPCASTIPWLNDRPMPVPPPPPAAWW